MDQFIPYDKLSKRQKRMLNRQKRRNWGILSPVTRKPPNPRAYNRKKFRPEDNSELPAGIFKPK